MKKLLLLLLLLPLLVQAQKTTHNITFDGRARTYIKYVPSTYTEGTAIPVLFSLHGLGGNASSFSSIGFEQLAEQNNFIVITPEAVNAAGFGTAWNSGAGLSPQLVLNGNVDDVGFISFILDDLIANYNIDESRVYSTGFSMGSFMSNRLACELNDRIAAVASVAGAIGVAIESTCAPERSVPFCHFHGTEDGTVSYDNNTFGTNAEETVAFWVDNANCSGLPDSTDLPDTKNDGITVKHYTFNNCDVEVEFYKAIGAGHSWLYSSQNDISYTDKIWEFLSRQSNPNAVSCASLSVDLGDDQQISEGQSIVLDATTTDASYSWQDGSESATFTVTAAGVYWVDVTVGNCTARDSVQVDFVTGLINANRTFDFSVYPNPMSNRGMVAVNTLEQTTLRINVFDVLGKPIFTNIVELSVGENSIPIEVNDVAKGTYILNVEMKGETSCQPFMVK